MDMSSSLLGVLKKTKWWLGPGVGKSVYELLEINGVIENRQASITQTIQGQLKINEEVILAGIIA